MPDSVLGIALMLAAAIGAFAAILFFVFAKLKTLLPRLVQQHLKSANEQFLQLAAEKFRSEQDKAKADMGQQKGLIDATMQQMKGEMQKVASLMQDIEKDRAAKFGNLDARLKDLGSVTSRLQLSTDKFTSILTNVKLRGQLGEWMADDILKASGLLEGIHYQKNKALETVSTRPDYLFLLPNGRKVCMDVKFPLDNYLAMVNSDSAELKSRHQDDFLRDVKNRIKEITRRDYVSHNEQTLDFVILFIPNEQVFGFIQEADPLLQNEGMKQKVIMSSPWTLYAFLSVIRQFVEHVNFEKRAREMLDLIKDFQGDFSLFKERFEAVGENLKKTAKKYEEITETSYKRLDQRVRKIDEYRKGEGILPEPPAAQPAGPTSLYSSE